MNILSDIWNKLLLYISIILSLLVGYLGIKNKYREYQINKLNRKTKQLEKKLTQVIHQKEVIRKIDEERAANEFNPSEFDK